MNRAIVRIRVLVSADPKKTTVFAALALVLVALAGRRLVDLGPSEASASDGASSQSPIDRLVDASDLDDLGSKGPIIRAPAPGPVERDLFRPDPSVFPRPTQAEEPARERPKSRAERADTQSERGASDRASIERRVRKEAESFRLKSVMTGQQPVAMLEVTSGGRVTTAMARAGGEVEGFSVIEIKPGSVVLEKQGVRVVLTR
jgi:hypothetical protein